VAAIARPRELNRYPEEFEEKIKPLLTPIALTFPR
jgi:hypothetical protein